MQGPRAASLPSRICYAQFRLHHRQVCIARGLSHRAPLACRTIDRVRQRMADSACPCPLPANDRGFALVAVVFVATIVAGLAVALLLLAQHTAQQGNDVVLEVENRAAGEAGLNRIILAYARPGDALREQLAGDGRPVEWEFAGKRLVLRAQAESGKLDLNAGPRDHIGALAQRLFGEPEALARFLGRLDEARSQGQSITSVLMLLSPFDRMKARRDLMEAHFT